MTLCSSAYHFKKNNLSFVKNCWNFALTFFETDFILNKQKSFSDKKKISKWKKQRTHIGDRSPYWCTIKKICSSINSMHLKMSNLKFRTTCKEFFKKILQNQSNIFLFSLFSHFGKIMNLNNQLKLFNKNLVRHR
jgi:hypothetical protein